MITVARRYRFAASHRLHSEALSEAENDALYGKCNNPYGHGHDYILEVSVRGIVGDRTGKLFGYGDLDVLVQRELLEGWEHRNLNRDVPEFATLVPTTEHLAQVVARRLSDAWHRYMPPNTWLARIYIEETPRNTFEIRLGKPIAGVHALRETEADLSHV